MSERIGVLTAGGDAPGLNAVLRAVVKAATERRWQVIGFQRGFEGLLSDGDYRLLDAENTRGILHLGGTILGTVNHGHFGARSADGAERAVDPEVLLRARATCRRLELRALICVGGDGSLAAAAQLSACGVPVIGVPKTIDGDVGGTQASCGFDSAVAFATDAVGRLHPTAAAHERVMVVETMGRHAGWIALHAAVGGGADFVLIPEIPWSFPSVLRKIQAREDRGRRFTIGVVAEGARWPDGGLVARPPAAEAGEIHLGGIGERLATQLEAMCGKECRCVSLGHLLRGGAPTNFDRLLATRFGVHAVELAAEGAFGMMVSYQPPNVAAVPLRDALSRPHAVSPGSDVVHCARALGICFGDD